jgi:hypothetical protein
MTLRQPNAGNTAVNQLQAVPPYSGYQQMIMPSISDDISDID